MHTRMHVYIHTYVDVYSKKLGSMLYLNRAEVWKSNEDNAFWI